MSNLNPHDMWAKMKKNSDGLVPAITVDYENGEVLMMAYMNEEAFCLTCETGFMHYYSRSTATEILFYIRSTRPEQPATQATDLVFIHHLMTGIRPVTRRNDQWIS